jgi:hypothetical protein
LIFLGVLERAAWQAAATGFVVAFSIAVGDVMSEW